jgi:hypothetical protein
MKTNLVKSMFYALISIFAAGCLTTAICADMVLDSGFVGGVYNYNQFSTCGTFDSIYSPSNDHYTIITQGQREDVYCPSAPEGASAINPAATIVCSVSYVRNDGSVSESKDLINNTDTTFDEHGTITGASRSLDTGTGLQTYNATVTHENGITTVAWDGGGISNGSAQIYNQKNQMTDEISGITDMNNMFGTGIVTHFTRDNAGNVTSSVTNNNLTGEQTGHATYQYGQIYQNFVDNGPNGSYLSATYNRTGNKLNNVITADAWAGQGIENFDRFGRVSGGTDTVGQAFEYSYNDSLNTVSNTYTINLNQGGTETLGINVVAGGILNTTTHGLDGQDTVSLYYGGSQNNPAGYYFVQNGVPQS